MCIFISFELIENKQNRLKINLFYALFHISAKNAFAPKKCTTFFGCSLLVSQFFSHRAKWKTKTHFLKNILTFLILCVCCIINYHSIRALFKSLFYIFSRSTFTKIIKQKWGIKQEQFSVLCSVFEIFVLCEIKKIARGIFLFIS